MSENKVHWSIKESNSHTYPFFKKSFISINTSYQEHPLTRRSHLNFGETRDKKYRKMKRKTNSHEAELMKDTRNLHNSSCSPV